MDRTAQLAAVLPMVVDFDVAMEVGSHEALVRQTYKDSAGVLTWCVGMTNATGHRVERYIGKPASVQHCMNLYVWALTSYAEQVREAFDARPLTRAQFAAALSFHWNTGAIKRASWVRYFLRGDDDAARKAFMNWVTPKEIAGRREKERDLFFDGKWSNDGTMLEYTRVRASMAPDWSSGRRLNVAEELRLAFADTADVILDQAPQPDAIPARPTLTPNIDSVPLPEPRPSPEPAEEPAVSNPVKTENELSPIDATNKANKGAGGMVLGSGGVGAGVIHLWSLTESFPDVWANDAQAMIVLTGLSCTFFGAIGGWFASYMAKDRRLEALRASLR